MKKQVRKGVFETNSSSTHSFTIGNNFNDLSVDKFDNCVHTSLGEFGWEVEDYYESSAKLAYILLVAAKFTGHYLYNYPQTANIPEIIEFMKTDMFKEIEDVVKSKVNCDGLIIDEDSEGYIDHQSLDYNSFEEWLSDTYAESIEDFIFGDIVLHTDNDNYQEESFEVTGEKRNIRDKQQLNPLFVYVLRQ